MLVAATCVSFMLLLTESLFSGIPWSAFAYFINFAHLENKREEGRVVLHDFLDSYEYT